MNRGEVAMKAPWKLFVSWVVVALMAAALVPAVALADSALPLRIGTQEVASYDLWVAGTQVTSDNARDVFGDGKVSYAPATSAGPATLTLKGYSGGAAYFDAFEGRNGALLGIYAKGDLTIDLAEGATNTIAGASYSGSPTISAAIGVEGGDLTITGPGTLKATGLDNPADGSIADSRGISVVNASLSESGQNTGGNLTIDGGATVAAIGGSVSAGGSRSYGIVTDADLAVTGGAELTATGGDAQNRSYGIVAGKDESSGGGAFLGTGAFTIDNGAVVVDFSKIGASTTVRGVDAGSLVMDNAGSIVIAVGEATVLTSLYIVGDVKMDNKSTIVATAEDMASTTAGVQAGSVTADNESSIDIALGNSRSVTGMFIIDGVKLDNKSAIAVSGGNASSFNSIGLRASGSATIDNGSSLDVTLGNAGRRINGFHSVALLVDGESAVSVSTGNASTNNSGMELSNSMAVNGGSAVTVTTGSAGGAANSAIICGSIAEIEDGVVTASTGTGGVAGCGFVVGKGIKVGENATVEASVAGGATGLSAGVIVYDSDEDSIISLGGRVSAEAGAGSGDDSGSFGFAVEKGPEISPTGFFEARGHTRAVGCVESETEDLTLVAAAVRAGKAYDGSDLADVESPFTVTGDYKAVMAGAAFGIALKGSEFTYDGTDKHITNTPTSTAATGETSFGFSFEKGGTYVDDLSSLKKTDAGEYTVYVKATNPNYINVATTTATLEVTPAPAIITVADASKVEGSADPAFTGKVEGLVKDGDLGTVSYKRTNEEEAPGTYKGVITATYTPNANYDVSMRDGDFVILRKTPMPDPNSEAPALTEGAAPPAGVPSAAPSGGAEVRTAGAEGSSPAGGAASSAPATGSLGKAAESSATPRTGDAAVATATALALAAALSLSLAALALTRRGRREPAKRTRR